jgi:glutathione S-transferase
LYQLYDFPSSHFCEKVRWALDYKGIAYQVQRLLPGFHLRKTRTLAPRSSVPILVGGGVVIQDSTAIIDYLERTFPDPALTPADPEQARAAVEWEEYLDEDVGVMVRRWFYFHTLPDRRRATRFLCRDASVAQRVIFAFAFPSIRQAMTKFMNIHPEPARQAEQRFLAALDKLDDALAQRPFLVGDRFSRADLTAGALLWPLFRPGESEPDVRKALVEPVYALRDQLKSRRSYGWVCDMYRRLRV